MRLSKTPMLLPPRLLTANPPEWLAHPARAGIRFPWFPAPDQFCWPCRAARLPELSPPPDTRLRQPRRDDAQCAARPYRLPESARRPTGCSPPMWAIPARRIGWRTCAMNWHAVRRPASPRPLLRAIRPRRAGWCRTIALPRPRQTHSCPRRPSSTHGNASPTRHRPPPAWP